MSEFPNNPEDVAAELSIAGDKWTHESLADLLNADNVVTSDAVLYFLEPNGSLIRFTDENLEDFGIVWVGFADMNGNPNPKDGYPPCFTSARDVHGSIAMYFSDYDAAIERGDMSGNDPDWAWYEV